VNGLRDFTNVDINNNMLDRGRRVGGRRGSIALIPGADIASRTGDVVYDLAGRCGTDEDCVAVLIVAGFRCKCAGRRIAHLTGRDELIGFEHLDDGAGTRGADRKWSDRARDRDDIDIIVTASARQIGDEERNCAEEQRLHDAQCFGVVVGRRRKRKVVLLRHSTRLYLQRFEASTTP
jgi:hypothetical protein